MFRRGLDRSAKDSVEACLVSTALLKNAFRLGQIFFENPYLLIISLRYVNNEISKEIRDFDLHIDTYLDQ